MSHFTVLVIGDDPEDQLAPYSEDIRVNEYDRGPVGEEELRQFVEYYESGGDAKKLYAERGEDWNGGRWRVAEDGEFHEYSTYNPISKWDWYRLGGWWTGFFKLKEGAFGRLGERGIFTDDPKAGWVDQTLKRCIDFDEKYDYRTFAVVKDGKWYERGEMGWWALVSNEKSEEDWDREFKALLESVPDDTLLSLYDCHI